MKILINILFTNPICSTIITKNIATNIFKLIIIFIDIFVDIFVFNEILKTCKTLFKNLLTCIISNFVQKFFLCHSINLQSYISKSRNHIVNQLLIDSRFHHNNLILCVIIISKQINPMT